MSEKYGYRYRYFTYFLTGSGMFRKSYISEIIKVIFAKGEVSKPSNIVFFLFYEGNSSPELQPGVLTIELHPS